MPPADAPIAIIYFGSRFDILTFKIRISHLNQRNIDFEKNDEFLGIGLTNMKTRAQLINSTLEINSIKNKGTSLTLKYKFV